MIAANRKTPKPCCVPGCDRPALSRGLCQGCYIAAREIINAGQWTWEKFEALGLAVHRKSLKTSRFRDALDAARRSRKKSAGRKKKSAGRKECAR